jgi:hypothetical protein
MEAWTLTQRAMATRRTYPTCQPWFEVFWRTLIGNRSVDPLKRPAPSIYGSYFRKWWRCIDPSQDFPPQNPLPPSPEEAYRQLVTAFPSWRTFEDFMGQANKYPPCMGSCIRGRRFCITSKGFVGLVPPGTCIQDSICIIFGAQTPFIVRSREKRHKTYYTLIGESYFHGMMDGEMMKEIPADLNDRLILQ